MECTIELSHKGTYYAVLSFTDKMNGVVADQSNIPQIFSEISYDFKPNALPPFEKATLSINDKKFGEFTQEDNRLVFQWDKKGHQAFHLTHGEIQFRLDLFNNKKITTLYSEPCLMLSQFEQNNENISSFLDAIEQNSDEQLNSFIFVEDKSNSTDEENSRNQTIRFRKKSWTSVSDYITLIKEIRDFFDINYDYFKQNFQAPINKKTKRREKNPYFYENEQIKSFFKSLIGECFNRIYWLKGRILSLEKSLIYLDENEEISSIELFLYHRAKKSIEEISKLKSELGCLGHRYGYESDNKMITDEIIGLPQKTSAFMTEEKYIQLYNIIVRWINFGECSIEKEQVLMEGDTLDKKFEYYCLFKLITLFQNKGWTPIRSEQYTYEFEDKKIAENPGVNNIYHFESKKLNAQLTLYYEPVIYGNTIKNDLNLYRTTLGDVGNDYYFTPDFIIKYKTETDEKYAILDAKYSTLQITKGRYFSDLTWRYLCQIAPTKENGSIKMLWALYGQMDNNDKTFIIQNSALANQFYHGPSLAITPLNTQIELDDFWTVFESKMINERDIVLKTTAPVSQSVIENPQRQADLQEIIDKTAPVIEQHENEFTKQLEKAGFKRMDNSDTYSRQKQIEQQREDELKAAEEEAKNQPKPDKTEIISQVLDEMPLEFLDIEDENKLIEETIIYVYKESQFKQSADIRSFIEHKYNLKSREMNFRYSTVGKMVDTIIMAISLGITSKTDFKQVCSDLRIPLPTTDALFKKKYEEKKKK
ncbi:MAG: hypothetical protein MJ250_06360 [Alphaproteobacteria bacterium]|nr:hypothetical protein [Alphaproteobacteria bacterium]